MAALPSSPKLSGRSGRARLSSSLADEASAEIISQPVFDIKPKNGDAADRKQRQRECNSHHAEQGSAQDDGNQCPRGSQLRCLTLDQRASHIPFYKFFGGI